MATSDYQRFLGALAESGHPIPVGIISRLSGLSTRQCGRISHRLFSDGRVSRTKTPEGGSYHRYFLTDAQLDDFLRVSGRAPSRGLAGVDAVSALDRLRFLRMLRDRTVYRDNQILRTIIDDYERTLGLAREAA